MKHTNRLAAALIFLLSFVFLFSFAFATTTFEKGSFEYDTCNYIDFFFAPDGNYCTENEEWVCQNPTTKNPCQYSTTGDSHHTYWLTEDGNATEGTHSYQDLYLGEGGTCETAFHIKVRTINAIDVNEPTSEWSDDRKLNIGITPDAFRTECFIVDGNAPTNYLEVAVSRCTGAPAVYYADDHFSNRVTQLSSDPITICVDGYAKHLNTWGFAFLDNFRFLAPLQNQIEVQPTPTFTDTDFNIINVVINSDTGLFVADVNCDINFNSGGFTAMDLDLDNNYFYYSNNLATAGVIPYDINCYNYTEYTAAFDSGTVTILEPLSRWLEFTPIDNISSYTLTGVVEIEPAVDIQGLEWCVDSNKPSALTVNYNISNSLNDGRQYFIYTADYNGAAYVFDDTLTYGSANDNPVQKIWQDTTSDYKYSFQDILTAEETKCYFLDYKLPAGHWEIFLDDDWFIQLTPTNTEIDGKQTSVFYVSGYSDAKNYLYQYLPELASSYNNSFEFQFTAWVDESTLDLKLGTTVNGSDSTETITLDIDKTRYSIEVDADNYYSQLLMLSDAATARTLYVTDIALIQRGYFTKRLNILDKYGDELPPTLFSGISQQSLTEGENYKFTTAAWDRDGDLNKLVLTAYLEAVADANVVRKYEFQFDSGAETEQEWDELIEGIIDLLGTAYNPTPPRQVKFKATLYDVDNEAVSTQSKWFRFIQYPFYPQDLTLNIIPINKKVASRPNGQIFISVKAPEVLLGVKVYVGLAEKSIDDYNFTTYWKDQDFSCTGFNCDFDFEFDNWVYEDENKYSMILSALLTTQYEDTSDPKTSKRVTYWVYYKTFETARIFQTVERTSSTYRQDEDVQLVVQLRDEGYTNMKNDISVMIEPYECDAASDGNCTNFGTDYFTDSFLYDAETGYNYYFFKQLFLKDTYTPPDDGNYVRFYGSISDAKNQFSSGVNPLLAPKCNVYDEDCSDFFCFYSNALAGISHFLFGCVTPTSSIVTITENTDEELRILIDEDYSPAAPNLECLACIKPDTNNVYKNNLKQDLICISWYTLNEMPVDKFDFYVANEYSDFSKEGDFQQYIKFTVPHALIMYNDPILLREALKMEYGTAATTLGQLSLQFLNYLFVGAVNYFGNVEFTEDMWEIGIVPNFGFDCNFSRPFDPTYLSGIIGYRVRGLDVINKYDYTQIDPEQYENVDPKDLIEYLYYIGEEPEIGKTNIEVYGSSLTKILEKELPSPLVIDVEYSEAQINKQNIDANTGASKFDVLPSTLRFELIHDLFYNGQRNVIRRYVSVVITTVISPKQIDLVTFFFRQAEEFIENPFAYLIKIWFVIFILAVVLVIVSIIYFNFRGGQTNISVARG